MKCFRKLLVTKIHILRTVLHRS